MEIVLLLSASNKLFQVHSSFQKHGHTHQRLVSRSSTLEEPHRDTSSSLKECQSAKLPLETWDLSRRGPQISETSSLHRRLVQIDGPPPPPPSLAGSAVCSQDPVDSPRIGGGSDGGWDVRFLCLILGLSGPDDLAIPIAEWEAHKDKVLRLYHSNARPNTSTDDPSISTNGRVSKKIRSWNRGMLLGSGSFGTVYEGISE